MTKFEVAKTKLQPGQRGWRCRYCGADTPYSLRTTSGIVVTDDYMCHVCMTSMIKGLRVVTPELFFSELEYMFKVKDSKELLEMSHKYDPLIPELRENISELEAKVVELDQVINDNSQTISARDLEIEGLENELSLVQKMHLDIDSSYTEYKVKATDIIRELRDVIDKLMLEKEELVSINDKLDRELQILSATPASVPLVDPEVMNKLTERNKTLNEMVARMKEQIKQLKEELAKMKETPKEGE